MAALDQFFDPSTVKERTDFECIPPGSAPAQIIKSGMEPNKAGTGKFALLEIELMEGPYTGKVLYVRLNLQNPSAKAVQIAEEELGEICRATGTVGIRDTDELHFKPMIVTWKVEPGRTYEGKEYGPSNAVSKYKPYTAEAARAAITAPVQAMPAAAVKPATATVVKPAAWTAGKPAGAAAPAASGDVPPWQKVRQVASPSR